MISWQALHTNRLTRGDVQKVLSRQILTALEQTFVQVTIFLCLAIWRATPDSCRSLSGSVLPVAAARIVFPPALQGLDAEQIKAVIKRAPLGRYDRKIARLRYVDQLCQVDIAARVPYCRTSIGNRLKIIDKLLNV
nr:MAG TPA: hypothetical protein [Caudoviricetes sp.]